MCKRDRTCPYGKEIAQWPGGGWRDSCYACSVRRMVRRWRQPGVAGAIPGYLYSRSPDREEDGRNGEAVYLPTISRGLLALAAESARVKCDAFAQGIRMEAVLFRDKRVLGAKCVDLRQSTKGIFLVLSAKSVGSNWNRTEISRKVGSFKVHGCSCLYPEEPEQVYSRLSIGSRRYLIFGMRLFPALNAGFGRWHDSCVWGARS